MSKTLASHMLQGNLLLRRFLVSNSRPIQWSHLLFFPRGNKFLSNKSCQARSKLHLRTSCTLLTLIRPREKLQSLALVLCFPWWTSPVFASTWTQSSLLSVQMMTSADPFSDPSQLCCHSQQSRLGTLVRKCWLDAFALLVLLQFP
jgi:hypothetical protein